MSDHNILFQGMIKKFGVLNQSLKCIEEIGELTIALSGDIQNYLNPINLKKNNVSEEIADVQIMLNQMKLIYPGWDEWYGKKILRLKNILSEGNE